MRVIPIAHGVEDMSALAMRSAAAPVPAFESLTVMLTELCNLDCWMCDFAVSKGLREQLPWESDDFLRFIRHPFFTPPCTVSVSRAASRSLIPTSAHCTSGWCRCGRNFFSASRAMRTCLSPGWRPWRTPGTGAASSCSRASGVQTHDVHRGRLGALRKSLDKIDTLRRHYPKLIVEVKFTVTPVNYTELMSAYRLITSLGLDFTGSSISFSLQRQALPRRWACGRAAPTTSARLPLLDAQERMCFLHRVDPSSAIYYVPSAIRLTASRPRTDPRGTRPRSHQHEALMGDRTSSPLRMIKRIPAW